MHILYLTDTIPRVEFKIHSFLLVAPFEETMVLVQNNNNKKVLLRERKRHTARRVVSTPSVVLTGHPPPPVLTWPGGGTLPGTPWQGTPVPPAGYPPLAGPGSVPPLPQLDLVGYPPLGVYSMAFWEMLQSIMGYGYPPRCLPHGILGNIAKHYGIRVPPPRCGQTENITFPILRMRAVIINNFEVSIFDHLSLLRNM